MQVDESILDNATAVLPIITAHLEDGEANARLAGEVVAAAGSSGPFRAFAPREVGGLEADLPTAAVLFEMISIAAPAVSWYMGNSAAACQAAARLARAERAELFAEPDRNFGYSAVLGGRAKPAGAR